MSKRKLFDPDAAKKSAKKIKARASTLQDVTGAAEAFLSAISAVDLDSQIYLCKESSSAELFLVGVLGLEGTYRLALANTIVPMNYPARLHVVTALLNSRRSSRKVRELEWGVKALDLMLN